MRGTKADALMTLQMPEFRPAGTVVLPVTIECRTIQSY